MLYSFDNMVTNIDVIHVVTDRECYIRFYRTVISINSKHSDVNKSLFKSI